MSRTIYLDAPNVGKLEKAYLAKAIDTGYVSTVGPFVPEFESKFAGYLGQKMAVSTQSGTAALHTCLYELEIGADDEVIVPALTFMATVSPVKYVGAKPVFVDVDRLTWNIDPSEIERKITSRTKAIIPVHLYGNPCDMEKIMKIAKKNGLHVIEDATESLGAKYGSRHTGTFGDFGCFSFNGNKIITTGGGGMVVSANTKRLAHIKFLVNQGRDESKGYFHPEIGFNYRMTNIEAALGLAQLEKLKGFLTKRKLFNKIYRQELEDTDSISFQEEYEGAENSSWFTCVLLNKGSKVSRLQAALAVRGIVSRRIFMPLTGLPPYRSTDSSKYRISRRIYDRGLCLPCSTLNSEDDIRWVARTIRKIMS